MWKTGRTLINGKVYKYEAKVYEEGSEFGIEEGRISKLSITCEDTMVVCYDRGWDIKPQSKDAEIALAIIMKENN